MHQNRKPSDEELLQWFDRLYLETEERLRKTAGAYLRSKNIYNASISQLNEDAVQETFILLWEKRVEVYNHPEPKHWLYATLKNTVRQLIRTEWYLYKYFLYTPEPLDRKAEYDGTSEVEFRNSLSWDEYMLLYKLYVLKYTYDELAQEMGTGRSALSMRVSRLKKRLRDRYRKI